MRNPTWKVTNYDWDSAKLVSNLLDDVYNATDDGISMKFEHFEADLFEQSSQMRRWDSWMG